MRTYIMMDGDMEVGIPYFEIEIDLPIVFEDQEDREFVRHNLMQCFSEIYQARVGVEFADERETWIDRETEMINQQEGM